VSWRGCSAGRQVGDIRSRGGGSGGDGRTLKEAVEEAERAAVAGALAAEDGNPIRTARALGIDRNTLKRKIRAFGMG